MPVCVYCARPVPALVAQFGSGHIALARCAAGCGRIADPYLEYGHAILVIDLVRPSAHSHRSSSSRACIAIFCTILHPSSNMLCVTHPIPSRSTCMRADSSRLCWSRATSPGSRCACIPGRWNQPQHGRLARTGVPGCRHRSSVQRALRVLLFCICWHCMSPS